MARGEVCIVPLATYASLARTVFRFACNCIEVKAGAQSLLPACLFRVNGRRERERSFRELCTANARERQGGHAVNHNFASVFAYYDTLSRCAAASRRTRFSRVPRSVLRSDKNTRFESRTPPTSFFFSTIFRLSLFSFYSPRDRHRRDNAARLRPGTKIELPMPRLRRPLKCLLSHGIYIV
jgi:hypothetical protein